LCDVEALKRGSESEWAHLQEKYLQRIYFYVRKQVADHQACEDIVQETILGAVRGIDHFDDRYSVEQFLFGIARNKVVDHLRRRRSREIPLSAGGDESRAGLENVLAASSDSPSTLVREGERAERERTVLVRILRTLVEKYWSKGDFHKLKAIELIFLENLSYREIAEEVGLRDERAVAGIKFQAIQDLQRFAMKEDPRHSLFSRLWRGRGSA
jgi:RNA polymerase sigma-70 factor (ECF subfamily)